MGEIRRAYTILVGKS